ncbi:MAG TPA: amidase [Acidimicrobiia bacterium]|nr:amidase [Acidimicrobiia bacterium]
MNEGWWSPAESLARLEEHQHLLNACTLIDHRPQRGRSGPLEGLALVVKDIIDQEGLPTTCGSGFYRRIPTADATVIERLRRAGASVVGRSGLHEWAYGFSSENPWFGPIRNPWDLATSPGGSSGGSAVAVAAGLVPAALGTDTGGSIRVPAALTGIYGLKTTWGRVPTAGSFPLAPSLDTIGPMARDAKTLSQVYLALSGIGREPEIPPPLRLGVPSGWVSQAPAEEGLAYWFGRVRDDLISLGMDVVEVDEPMLVPWGKTVELAGFEAAAVHRPFRSEGKPYGPEVGLRLEAAEQVSGLDYAAAHRWRAGLVEAFVSAFERVDLLITPAVAARRKVIGDDRIGERHYRGVLSWFSSLVNHAGLPAIVIPLTMGDEASLPPPSLQVIAPWWRERALLALADRLEGEGMAGLRLPPHHIVS